MSGQDVSMVFNMLPTAISSRLPAFRSLRRSASLSIMTIRRKSVPLEGDKVDELAVAIRHDTQFVERRKGDAAPMARSMEHARGHDTDNPPPAYPQNDRSSSALVGSGVKWPYASQGL